MGLLGLVVRGGLAGADRPDRLVGNNDLCQITLRNLCQPPGDLPAQYRKGITLVALGQGLADAEQHGQAGSDGCAGLFIDRDISFPEILAPF